MPRKTYLLRGFGAAMLIVVEPQPAVSLSKTLNEKHEFMLKGYLTL
ncbi:MULTISPECIES: hypothetical protein [unclassified Rhizobium]|nr:MULTISPECIES: hypothetical protein [unclassified Rhizobium]